MIRRNNILSTIFVALLSGLLLFACGGKKSTQPEKTAQQLTAEAWDLFESADYDGAKSGFEQALSKDGNYADAYNGRGWSRGFLGLKDEALADFQSALAKGLNKPDAHVGLAGLYLGKEEFQNAATHALAALSSDSDYSFSHKSSINYLDLHLILAQSYYGLGGDYLDSAQVEVDYLNPANHLDPADPNTWTVSGQTYATYPEALLKEIQRLEQTVGEP
jgi:tetratricopeptide (TPR) repeat protein